MHFFSLGIHYKEGEIFLRMRVEALGNIMVDAAENFNLEEEEAYLQSFYSCNNAVIPAGSNRKVLNSILVGLTEEGVPERKTFDGCFQSVQLPYLILDVRSMEEYNKWYFFFPYLIASLRIIVL